MSAEIVVEGDFSGDKPLFASRERGGVIPTDAAVRGEQESAETAQPAALTLDQLAEDTLNRVAAFIGECVGGDTFCALSIDEVRDEHGLLLSLKLVPCDTVDGEPVRREAR